jgi:hypothetical protein
MLAIFIDMQRPSAYTLLPAEVRFIPKEKSYSG